MTNVFYGQPGGTKVVKQAEHVPTHVMEPDSSVAPRVIDKQQCRNQRLVDIFAGLAIFEREKWLTLPVDCVATIWDDKTAVGLGHDPDHVKVYFSDGSIYQYLGCKTVCDIVSALQECSSFKPSTTLQDFLNQYRKIEHIKLECVVKNAGENPEEVVKYIQGAQDRDRKLTAFINEPIRFSDAPFKVIRDYLYACSFLSPYAPKFVDYANDLLAYRLSYAISQEKHLDARTAITNLARELNDFARNHTDGAWGLRVCAKVALFSGEELPALTVRSDFGILTVDYEPELTMSDWEKRYNNLRRKHG